MTYKVNLLVRLCLSVDLSDKSLVELSLATRLVGVSLYVFILPARLQVIMDTEDRNTISYSLGCDPVKMDSMYVSPMKRPRLYWSNIPGLGKITFL